MPVFSSSSSYRRPFSKATRRGYDLQDCAFGSIYRWIVRLTAGSLLSQLTEDELRIWITVLNHGEAPSDEDLEEVIETLDNYREEMGAEGTEGVLELSDFLLVTFDYYLAMGAARMRALYIDLLLT